MPEVCNTIPGQTAVAPVAAHVEITPVIGWNSGANSVRALGGSCYVQCTINNMMGAIIGLAHAPREDVASFVNLTHAFHIGKVGGTLVAQVMESAEMRGTPFAVQIGMMFHIRRIGSEVSYWVGETAETLAKVYDSTVPSFGVLQAGGMPYASGDELIEAEFEPFGYGTARGSFGFVGFGGEFESGGWGHMAFRGSGTQAFGGGGSFTFRGFGGEFESGGWGGFTFRSMGAAGIPPISGGVGHGEFGFRGYGLGRSVDYVEASGAFGFTGSGGEFESGGTGVFGFRGYGRETSEEQNAILLLQSPGVLYTTIGYLLTTINESIGTASQSITQPIYILSSGVGMGASNTSVLDAINSVTDGLTLVDALGVIYKALAQDGFTLSSTGLASHQAIMDMVDALMLAGEPGSALAASNIVAEALALQDVIGILSVAELSDELTASTAFSTALAARQSMIDGWLMNDTANNTAIVHLVAEDAVALNATPQSVLAAMNTLTDSISFALTFRLGDSVYAAWVCNTELKAFSNYENYPFNSFFELRGRYYGVAEDGVYLLEGDTDDGQAIGWRIRTGLMNLGTGKMKRMPSVYFGLRTDGDMVLKVVTTSDTGDKVENWYRLVAPPAMATRESRVKLGRGLKSVFWGFELEGIDGADAALHGMELYPMILDRRIHGGSNGA